MQSLSENSSKHLVVASTTGETGILFSQAFQGKGIDVVVVTHSSGFKEPNSIEMPSEMRKAIEAKGAKVYTGSMLTHSLETAFASKFNGLYPTMLRYSPDLAVVERQLLQRQGLAAMWAATRPNAGNDHVRHGVFHAIFFLLSDARHSSSLTLRCACPCSRPARAWPRLCRAS